MKRKKQRLMAAALAAALSAGLGASAFAAQEPAGLTRAQTRDLLLAAARDYNPDVTGEDILHGYEDGQLHLERTVTRAEALVMLERAFGGLPEPVGANRRSAFPAGTFTDVPTWAVTELEGVFTAGIVAGTGAGILSPDRPVTEEELTTLIRRVYALEGTNLKDDFYAAVNKDWLDASVIPAGEMGSGTLYEVGYAVNEQVAKLITDIASQPQKKGSVEARIAALYQTVMDVEGREKAGADPIRLYLDDFERAGSLSELMKADCQLEEELGISTLMGYGLSADLLDSSRYTVTFSTFNPGMDKDFYASGTQAQKDAYFTYLTTLLTLSGFDQETAAGKAQRVYDLESVISAASLDVQEKGDVDKIYNIYTPEALAALFPEVNLDPVYAASGLEAADRIVVSDKGALEAAASLFTGARLEDLKAEAQLNLIQSVASCLNQEFWNASVAFQAAYYGVEGSLTTEQLAARQVQSLLSDYLSRAYAEAYFTPEAKADVEDMVDDFLDIYTSRIKGLDWMSAQTKEKALNKLKTMQVKVGYPDSWDTYLDNAEIKAPEEGGSFFSNVIAIQKAATAEVLSRQNKPVDKSEWVMPVYMVNACYNPSANDITFPAAILQAPMYDVNASREENLGGIGYVIAHEITHAFDNNGCKFDEYGNAATSAENPYGWWTQADYTAFEDKCQDVIDWYDGQEAAPGLACSGELTLSENVADLGAANCLVEAASREAAPDYATLFRSMAQTWAGTYSRETMQYILSVDVHAPDKLRANRVLQTLPLFYETFGITEGDGMWTEPESRVSIW